MVAGGALLAVSFVDTKSMSSSSEEEVMKSATLDLAEEGGIVRDLGGLNTGPVGTPKRVLLK